MGFFGKTLVVIAVAIVLWWIWRRMNIGVPRNPSPPPPPDVQARTPFWRRPKVTVQETETCKTCGAYVTAGAGRCAREACPY